VFGSKVQKGKRVKILPFAKSGKIFTIRDVWIQMAKVLAKTYLNPFSPSPIPFPATSFPRGRAPGGGAGRRADAESGGMRDRVAIFAVSLLPYVFAVSLLP
jgi:hypothetical protein